MSDFAEDKRGNKLREALQGIASLPSLDETRLKVALDLKRFLQTVPPRAAFKFLLRTRGEEGWGSWAAAIWLRQRGFKPESVRHLNLALTKMTGIERAFALLDLARLKQKRSLLKEVETLAYQQRPKWKVFLLWDVVDALRHLGQPEAQSEAVSLSQKLIKFASPFCSDSYLGLCWELQGEAFLGLRDFHNAKKALLEAAELYHRKPQLSRVYGSLSFVASQIGDYENSLSWARLSLEKAKDGLKKSRHAEVARVYESGFDYTRAAISYASARGFHSFDPARLADLRHRAGNSVAASRLLEETPSKGASVYYALGELEKVKALDNSLYSQILEVELAEPQTQSDLLRQRQAASLNRLPEPARSLVKRRLQRKDLALHPRTCSHEIRQLRIQPVIFMGEGKCPEQAQAVCRPFLRSLTDFHRREFGQWSKPPIIEDFRLHQLDWKEFGPANQADWQDRAVSLLETHKIRRRSRNRIVLIFHVVPFRSAGFRGAASYTSGIAHIWVSDNRFVDKVALHEFYHSALQLEHSHGSVAPRDRWCLMTQGEFALSTRYLQPFQKAVCLTPRSVQKRIHRGLKAVEAGCWSEAIEHYQVAFAEDPLHYWLARELGYCLYRERRFKEARKVYEHHARFYPGQESKADLLDAFAFGGFIEKAKKLERHWPRGDNPGGSILRLVRAWKTAGRFGRALELALDGLTVAGYSSELFEEIGMLWWQLGKRHKAERVFLEAMERGAKPQYQNLALVACERGMLDRARSYLDKGRDDLHPAWPPFLEMRFAFKEGRTRDAEESLQTLCSTDHNKELRMGYEYFTARLAGEARPDLLEELNRQARSLEWCWLAHVWSSMATGRPDKRVLQAGILLFPVNPLWNLTRYLVTGCKPPRPYFHTDILKRFRANRIL